MDQPLYIINLLLTRPFSALCIIACLLYLQYGIAGVDKNLCSTRNIPMAPFLYLLEYIKHEVSCSLYKPVTRLKLSVVILSCYILHKIYDILGNFTVEVLLLRASLVFVEISVYHQNMYTMFASIMF